MVFGPPLPKLLTRPLRNPVEVGRNIWGHYLNPEPSKRTARKVFSSLRKGPAYMRWYPPHMRQYDKTLFRNYQTEEDKYWKLKAAWLKFIGKSKKKGEGKRAKLRQDKVSKKSKDDE
eukprot:TRINITY_DN2042_c0_g1_i1.p1 TRINITY_DN2042_c0_g1~~TRINITY_DN2042_c0_g1_i1.p1  ORF type:complete len:117 (-),score=22.49 TRINITY_DN2042_c0_g1_i1:119-469(-)